MLSLGAGGPLLRYQAGGEFGRRGALLAAGFLVTGLASRFWGAEIVANGKKTLYIQGVPPYRGVAAWNSVASGIQSDGSLLASIFIILTQNVRVTDFSHC